MFTARLRWVSGLLVLAALFGAVPDAAAHKRDFVFTYQWWTPARGEKEIEPWMTLQPDASKWSGALEFETAVTDRWVVAPYLLYGKAPGSGFRTDGWKLEQRYRFGEFARGKVLPAVYWEVKKERGNPYELELKLLLSRYGTLNSAVNLVAEKAMASRQRVEWGYAAGTSLSLARQWRFGAEFSGSLTDREHFAGPTVAYGPTSSVRVLLGAGVGLNRRSEGRVRMIAEYEWF